jgi:hypothetical protein
MAETNPFADPNYGLEPGAQENPFSNPDYGKDTDGPLARGWKKSKQSIAISRDLTTGDVDSATQNIAEAERYARANPGLPEGRELSQAWDRGEGISGGVKEVAGEIKKDWDESSNWVGGLRATGRNLRAMGEVVIEQAPNMVAPVTGMIAGGAAGAKVGGALGSVVPGAGTAAGAAVGGFAGGWAGASAGNAAIEGGYMAQEALQKAGIDPQDTQAVRQFLLERGDSIMGDAAVKGGIIGAVDAVTFGVAGRLLNGPARAAASRALADMGVDTANSAAVKAAMQTPQFAQRIAGDAVYQASRTGAQNVARNVGAAALEPAGEFAGEYLGQGVATGEWDAKNAALEAFSSIGQSGAMFAGQKAYQYVTRPRSAQGEQTPPEAGTAPPAGPQGFAPTAERPVIDEAALGRAGVYPPAPAPIINERALEPAAPTPSQQIFTPTAERPVIDEAALGRAGVYPPAPAPIINERALEPAAPTPSQQMGLDPAAGPMSAAAALAVDTGASATMQQAAQAVDPAPAIDVSGRTDEQLRVLEKAGRDGWREAAVAEIQRRATQQQAETPAPAVEPAAQAAVEQQAPAAAAPSIKDVLAKQITDMSDGELRQAIDHYGPSNKRTVKLLKEVQRRAQGAAPDMPATAQQPAESPEGWDGMTFEQRTAILTRKGGWATAKGGLNVIGKKIARDPWAKINPTTKATIERLMQGAPDVQPAQMDAASGQGSGAIPAGSAGVAPGRPVDIGRVDRPAGAPAPGSRARVPVGTAGAQQPAGVEGATDTAAPVAQPAAPQGAQPANVPPTEQVAPQAQEARGQEGEADGENQALELVRELRARFAATPKDIPIAGARIQKGGGSLPGGFEDSLWRVVLANGQTYGGGYRTRAEAERVMERGTVSNPEYSANEDALNAAIDRLAQIKGRANGVTTGGQEGAGSESAGAEGAAGGVTAPADAFDVSGRTDAQLRVLVESGKPGWREAAIAEVARREAVAAEQPAQAPTAPEQSRPAPGQRSEPAQPIQQPQAIQQDTQADAPEFTTLKDRDGKTVTVRTADLSSTRERMPTFTKEGKRRTAWIHRDNLDPTGEKQAEGAKEMANNPLFNVITTKDGGAFAIKAAASRELNARGLAETHEVVPAGDVQAGLKGYLVRKKAEAPAASSFPEQAGAEGGDEEAMQVRRYQQKTDQWNSRVKKFGLQKIIEEARSAVAGHVLGREFGEAVEDFYKRDAAARATRDWLAAKEAAPSRATTKDERKPAEQQQPGATTPAWRTVKSAPFADQASAVLALMNAAQKPSQSEEVVKAVRALARSAEESGDATARGIATFIADNALEALASHKINAGRGSVVEKARHKKLKDGIERLRSLEVERVTRGDESPATAAPQATHKDPGQPAEPAQQQEKAADTQAAAERTEYPFGEVPTNQESKFFRSRVRVLPEMRGDTAWDGEVGSILNGGRLLEVTRDGRDFSVRVRGERIEVLERVENGIKESEVKFDASVNDRWSSIVAATNEESGAQRSVQALARFAGATGEPVNDVWGRWRDFIGATELAGRTGEQVVRWMESNLISEPWDDRAIPGNDVNGSMGSTPDYWRSKLADYERAMTAFNEADARMDQQTFDVERVDGSPERTKAAREILSGMRKKAAENGEYIRKKVQEAEKNEAEETARAEEDRLSRFKPFDAGLASKKPSVASITGWFAGTWSNGANTAWSDGSIADLYGEPHLKGWETRKANKRTTPDVDRVIPRNSNDPLEPVGMYDSKVGQTKGVMYYQMGDSVLPFALHYVQYFMSKYKGAKLVGNLNTPSGPAAVVHEGRTVGVIMPMRVNQVTAEELRENIAKGEKITQQREKADPTAQERTEQPAAEATAHPPAANQPALTGPRRNPTQVSAFAPYAAGDIVALDGQDWQVQQDMGGWYLTSTGNWRGMHPTIQKIRGMNELIAEIERAATAQPATAEQGDAPAGTEATAADLMTPEQARALMVWEDLGQRDNVKSMRLAFFESAERMAAKRGAMNYGTIESYQGGKWNIDGTTYPTLKAAKAAAEEAALVRLANDGYVAQPFAAYDAVARTYGYEVRADGAIGGEGKFPGPTIKEKGGRLRVESGKGDLLGSYPATPESLGKFLENFWGAEKQVAQPAADQPTSDRDQFTVERVDEDQRQTLTFVRGETVKVSGKYPMETGKIDGISNARKEFRIGGAWLPFGYAYKAEYDEFAAPRRELEEMIANAEKRIADGTGFQRDGYPIRDAREHAKRYSLKGYEDTLNDLAKRGQATFDRRIAEDSARIAAAKQADRERREAADAADAAKYAGPVKMTMDEWKRIGRDFKSFNGGNRTVMQDGRIRRVEIVKEKAEAPEGSFMDPSLPVQTGVNARMVVIDRPAVDDGVLRPGDADPEVAFSATLPRDRNAVRIGITEKGLVRAMRLQFDGLADVTSKLLERGRSGKRGGVIVVSTADNAEIGRIVAERTGRKLDSTMRKFSSAGRLNGFYDPKTGLTFLVAPNLNPVTATAVMLHEMMHGQQRQKIDARALEMVRNRHGLKDEGLRAFLDRVMLRMIAAGEVGNAAEASAYIVEQAVIEGRSAGYTFADNAFMQWVDAKIGKRVGDFLRSFAGMIRTWMLRNGLGAKAMTVDDFVGYAMAGLDRAAAGEVRGSATAASAGDSADRPASPFDPDRAWRDLISRNKLSDYDRPAEFDVTSNDDDAVSALQRQPHDFTLSKMDGGKWVALAVRETQNDDGDLMLTASLESGDYPKGSGIATKMYLSALNVARQRGIGWTSEGVRSDNALAMYARLKRAGIPFVERDGSSVIDAAALAEVNLKEVAQTLLADKAGRAASGADTPPVGNNPCRPRKRRHPLQPLSRRRPCTRSAARAVCHRGQDADRSGAVHDALERRRESGRCAKGAGEVAAPGKSRRCARPEDCPPRRHGPGQHGECPRLHGNRL